MRLGIIIYIVGWEWIIIMNRNRNILNYMILIEILYLSIIIIIISVSINIDDVIGILYSLYLIIITGIESVIGLCILIDYYRVRGSLKIRKC